MGYIVALATAGTTICAAIHWAKLDKRAHPHMLRGISPRVSVEAKVVGCGESYLPASSHLVCQGRFIR